MRKLLYTVILLLFFISVGAAASTPQKHSITVYTFTDTIQDRVNVTETIKDNETNTTSTEWRWVEGPETYMFDIDGFWTDYTRHDDGSVKDVEITAELQPNNLTRLLDASKEPWKSIADGKHDTWDDRVHYFNHHWYWNGSNISQSQMDTLVDEIDSVPVYGNDELVKTINMKDGAKNVTAKIKLRNGTGTVGTMQIGNNSASFTVSTQADWNNGDVSYNQTSADRDADSGVLGIGYVNGSNPSTTTQLGADNQAFFYRMDESSPAAGTTVADYSGNGNDGSVINGATAVNGLFGTGAYDLDTNNNEAINAGTVTEIGSTNDITVSIWMKSTASGLNTMFMSRHSTNNMIWELDMGLNTDGDVRWLVRDDDGDTISLTADPGLNDGKWHHVVGTFDSSSNTAEIIVDGVSQGTNTDSTVDNFVSQDQDVYVGARSTSDNNPVDHFDGTLDEAMVMTEPTSVSEAQQLYFSGKDGTFGGDYNSTAFNVPSGEKPTDLEVNADSVSGITDAWATVSTDNGESDTVKLDTNGTKNYSLSFSNTGGTAWADYNFSSSDETKTAEVNDFTLYTESTSDTTAPSITIHNPPNSTISDATPDLEVTADESVDTWIKNVDASGNTTFTPNITLSELTDGGHNVTVYANDSNGNTGSNTRYFTVEEPPNITNLAASPNPVDTGNTVNITADITDNGNLDSQTCVLKDADGNIEADNVSMSTTSSDTFFLEHIPTEEPSNIGQWDATCHANDTEGASSMANTTFTVNDGTPPQYRNAKDNVTSPVEAGNEVTIEAEFNSTGTDLSNVVLATNESGSWFNWTNETLFDGTAESGYDQIIVGGKDDNSVSHQPYFDTRGWTYPDKSVIPDETDTRMYFGMCYVGSRVDDVKLKGSAVNAKTYDIDASTVPQCDGSAGAYDWAESSFIQEKNLKDGKIRLECDACNSTDYYRLMPDDSSSGNSEWYNATSGSLSSVGFEYAIKLRFFRYASPRTITPWYEKHDGYPDNGSCIGCHSSSSVSNQPYFNLSDLPVDSQSDRIRTALCSVGSPADDLYIKGSGVNTNAQQVSTTDIPTCSGNYNTYEWITTSVPASDLKNDTIRMTCDSCDTSNYYRLLADDSTTGSSEYYNATTGNKNAVPFDYMVGVDDKDTINVWEKTEFVWENDAINQYFGHRLWVQDSEGDWNKTGIDSFAVSGRPYSKNASLTWTGVGGSTTKDVTYGYEEPDGDRIESVSSPPSGSLSFDNDTATVTGWSSPFDWLAEPTDSFGLSPTSGRAINFSTTDSGLREDDFGHNVSEQRVNRTITVDNRGEALNYTLGLADEGTVVTDGGRSGELAADGSVTTTEVWKGDWLTPTQYDFAPQKGEVTLGVDYIGDRAYELGNSKAVQFTDVDITENVTAPSRCSQSNNTKVDIGASATTNYTVQFKCPPGTEGTPELLKTVDADSDNDTHYNYTTEDLEIYSNETRQTNVTWKIDKDNLTDYSNRKATPVAYIDGNSTGVTIENGVGYVYVTFTTDCCSSSPSAGTYSASLFYEVGESDTSSDDGGSTGSSGGDDVPEDAGARLHPAEPYELEYGTAENLSFTAKNFKNQQNKIQLSVDPSRSNGCAYVKLPAVTTGSVDDSGRPKVNSSDVYGHEAVVRLPSASAGLTGASSELPVPVEITMPDEATFERLQNENGSLVCRFSASAERGSVNDLVIEVQPEQNPFTGLFVTANEFVTAFVDALLDMFTTTRETCFGENNTALLTNETAECPETAQETRRMPNRAGAVLIITIFTIGIAGLLYRYR